MSKYFDDSEIELIIEKTFSEIKNKNYHRMRIEAFLFYLLHKKPKKLSKFFKIFFKEHEDFLNNNYFDIFSKDLKSAIKSTTTSPDNANCNQSNTSAPNPEADNSANGINHSNKAQYSENNIKKKTFNEYKKYFELNFNKTIFANNEDDYCLKAKIFARILKAVLKANGLIQSFRLINDSKSILAFAENHSHCSNINGNINVLKIN